MNRPMKELYFKRALLKKKPKPPKRLKRLLYPERVEAQYRRALEGYLEFIRGRVDARIKPLIPELVAHFGRVRKDEFDEPNKYYTAFIYEKTKNENVLHCTHKYLGTLDRADVVRIEKTLDTYFFKRKELPSATFDQVEFFGPAKDIRVLTPSKFNPDDFFPDLRAKLYDPHVVDYDPYRPHVTTDQLQEIDAPFGYYALISKRGIHRTWPKVARKDDSDLGDLADQLEQVRIETTQEFTAAELSQLAKLTGTSVAEWNAAQLNGQLKGIVEIDLFGEGGEPWLAREMGAFVHQNVSLIESIGDEYLGQVEKMIATAVRGGLRVEEIAADLDDRFDVSLSRATLIARDQVGKFNGQLTEARQKDLGVEEYTWRGVGDARERDSHRILNNTVQRWDDPPEPGHPGEDYQCRCWAEPVLAKFYEGEDNG